MKYSLNLKSSAAKITLFFITFSIGISASTLFLFKSFSPNVAQIEIKQISENKATQIIQSEDVSSEQTESTLKVVQSELVDFPVNGRVIVESIEEVGKFPQMVFRSKKTGDVLLHSSIEDEDKWLIPVNDNKFSQPALRFRAVRSKDSKSSMIMSIGIYHGGSDNAYYLTVFGEMDGKITRLNEKPLFANIQGGYYLGHLSEKFGYGLAVWTFIWDDASSHYDNHKYNIEIYQLKNGKLEQVLKKVSEKTYNYNKGFNSLRELGIKATDQRKAIPEIKESLDLE
jgi:hypothetical protein